MKKRWDGKYKVTKCFVKDCDGQGVTYNPQRIPVCNQHKNTMLKVDKCPLCGGFAEVKQGKYGAFILCAVCGCINIKKYIELTR